ncbi:MAG TPA: HDOD domain-containing protein [Chromatiales bacterium]|nr:HDOD domain-containing protein [Thiotrichales bacterium]HIP69585.1 HDOD domain-containing protein [Chromatiales bacterium]
MENISEIGLKFIQTLSYELNSGKLDLPTFPDVAMKIKKALEDPDVSAEQVARVVSAEPVLSARLLKVANSAALNRAGVQINDIHTAITRLGFDMVHNTAVSIAMEQMVLSNAVGSLRHYLEEVWRNSVHVAALSYVIAKKQTSINPDEAMLVGLLHSIGKIYIVTRIEEKFPELFNDADALEEIMQQWHSGVGSTILGAWNFSEALTTAVDEHNDVDRTHFGPPDLADIVLVANLYSNLDKPGQDWTTITAIERLNLTPETAKKVLDESMEEVQSVKQALGC